MQKTGKKVLLGVTGGIAAYKIPLLVRLLIKAGYEVQVIATTSALDFVSEKTLAVLSGKPVITDFYTKDNTWNNHVKLGLWADVFLIAPATANSIAKMVQGQSDNLFINNLFVCTLSRCGFSSNGFRYVATFIHPKEC